MFRSEKLRRAVVELDCQWCGIGGETQAAHRNEGKGMGMKTSDALVAALCAECHRQLDQGKLLDREERRAMWDKSFIKTMQALIENGKLVVKG